MKQLSQLESDMFASLSNPKRIEILHILQHGSATVGEIVEMTGIAQANVSQHLSVMRRLKLVTVEKQAQIRHYSLASKHLTHICDAMRQLLQERYGVLQSEELDKMHLHTDPVCGMKLAANQAASFVTYEHKRYYFCGIGCSTKFLKEQTKYV